MGRSLGYASLIVNPHQCLIPKLTIDVLVIDARVIVGIELLTARGAKDILCGFESSAALHREAKRNMSVARNIFGEHQAGI